MVNLPRHPSQLYEAFFEGIFLWAITWAVRKKNPFKGFGAGLYIAGYGLIRFIIEYFRQPDSDMGYPVQFVPNNEPLALAHPLSSLSTGQILCLGMVLAGVGIWIASACCPNSAFSYDMNVGGQSGDTSSQTGREGRHGRTRQKKRRRR
jgi:phosphatidylglycerol:prolipoprotein diacylglycerol transferase